MRALRSVGIAFALGLFTAFICFIAADVPCGSVLDRDMIEFTLAAFGVLAAVSAVDYIISAFILGGVMAAEKIRGISIHPSGALVYLAANVTLLAVSGVLIVMDLSSSGSGIIDLSGLLTLILMITVVPVCTLFAVICFVMLIVRRRRRND